MTSSDRRSDDGDLCGCCMAVSCAQGFRLHCKLMIWGQVDDVVRKVHFFDVSSTSCTFWIEVQLVTVKKRS
jgi:hypothetical protein